MCSGSDANPEGFYMAMGRGQCVPLTEPAPECLTLPDLHPTQSTSPPASNPSHYAGPVPLGEKTRQIPITLSHQGQQKALNLY